MLNFFLDCVILFLLFYALVCIFDKISDFAFKKTSCRISCAVIKPTNCENLEYDIRKAASFALKNGFPLLVVDSELSESSKYIINALSYEFSNILLVSHEDLPKKMLN